MKNGAVLLLMEAWSFIKRGVALELTSTVCVFTKGSRSDPRNYFLQDMSNVEMEIKVTGHLMDVIRTQLL